MQINDGKGNSFNASKAQETLYNAGWRVVERKKRGMMWIIRWFDPLPNGNKTAEGRDLHDIHSQGMALQILKDRKTSK